MSNRNKSPERSSVEMEQAKKLAAISDQWMLASLPLKYSYNFTYLGRPIIQYPQDMVALQELIWFVKPDLVIETGIAHGGSLIMNAAMLSLLDYCEALQSGGVLDPARSKRRVLGIDIDVRWHNRQAIEEHPLSPHIEMIEGSSIDDLVISDVVEFSKPFQRILVCLDSNHTHDHVFAELEAYTPLVSLGSYCVVFDTVIEDLPAGLYPDRPWDVGNSPKTAVSRFLEMNDEFEVDNTIDSKLMISVAPQGYLKRTKNR